MALAKFSDWIVNEMGESLPSTGTEQAGTEQTGSEEQVKAQLSQFKSSFDRLLDQIRKSPAINKGVARTMLDELIAELSRKTTGLTSKEVIGMERLGGAVHNART